MRHSFRVAEIAHQKNDAAQLSLGRAGNASNLVPDRAEGIEGLILSLGTFEKVKRYNLGTLSR
jgi:hypothetical protein